MVSNLNVKVQYIIKEHESFFNFSFLTCVLNVIDLNISSDESPALDIEPLKNDVPNSSSIKKDTPVLVIHKPKLYKVCLDNIPGTEQPVFNKVLVSFDLLGPILLLLSG